MCPTTRDTVDEPRLCKEVYESTVIRPCALGPRPRRSDIANLWGNRMNNRFSCPASTRALVVTALSAALVATACGADDEPDVEVEELESSDELTDLVPEEYQGETVVVGVNPEQEPIKYVDDEGEFAGLSIDQFTAASNLLGLDVEYENTSFDALMPGIEAGTFDAIVSISDFEDRHEQLVYIDYIDSGVVYVGHPDEEHIVEDIPEDICGMSVAFTRGTGSQGRTEENAELCEELGLEPIEAVGYADSNSAFLAIQTGENDLLHTDSPPAYYNEDRSPENFEVLYYADSAPLGIAFGAEETELMEAYREALFQLAEEGTFQELAEGWGVEDEILTDFPVNLGEGY